MNVHLQLQETQAQLAEARSALAAMREAFTKSIGEIPVWQRSSLPWITRWETILLNTAASSAAWEAEIVKRAQEAMREACVQVCDETCQKFDAVDEDYSKGIGRGAEKCAYKIRQIPIPLELTK